MRAQTASWPFSIAFSMDCPKKCCCEVTWGATGTCHSDFPAAAPARQDSALPSPKKDIPSGRHVQCDTSSPFSGTGRRIARPAAPSCALSTVPSCTLKKLYVALKVPGYAECYRKYHRHRHPFVPSVSGTPPPGRSGAIPQFHKAFWRQPE